MFLVPTCLLYLLGLEEGKGEGVAGVVVVVVEVRKGDSLKVGECVHLREEGCGD